MNSCEVHGMWCVSGGSITIMLLSCNSSLHLILVIDIAPLSGHRKTTTQWKDASHDNNSTQWRTSENNLHQTVISSVFRPNPPLISAASDRISYSSRHPRKSLQWIIAFHSNIIYCAQSLTIKLSKLHRHCNCFLTHSQADFAILSFKLTLFIS